MIIGFVLMRYKETTGHLPFVKAKAKTAEPFSAEISPGSSAIFEGKEPENTVKTTTAPARTVSE